MLVVPETTNLTVKSSRAGSSSNSSRFLYPTLVFYFFHALYLPLIYATAAIFLSYINPPLSTFLPLHNVGLCYRSSKPSHYPFSPVHILLFFRSLHVFSVITFVPSCPVFILVSLWPRLFSFLSLTSDDDHDTSSVHTLREFYIHLAPIHLNCLNLWSVLSCILKV